MNVSKEFVRRRLTAVEKDAFIEELSAAAKSLGARKLPTLSFPNDDGTWDVGGTLEGEALFVEAMTVNDYLNLPLNAN